MSGEGLSNACMTEPGKFLPHQITCEERKNTWKSVLKWNSYPVHFICDSSILSSRSSVKSQGEQPEERPPLLMQKKKTFRGEQGNQACQEWSSSLGRHSASCWPWSRTDFQTRKALSGDVYILIGETIQRLETKLKEDRQKRLITQEDRHGDVSGSRTFLEPGTPSM